jgi:hypothetical protein
MFVLVEPIGQLAPTQTTVVGTAGKFYINMVLVVAQLFSIAPQLSRPFCLMSKRIRKFKGVDHFGDKIGRQGHGMWDITSKGLW